MPALNATELAERLGVSKPRISQYVSEGKLAGCYSGEGRARRFDLAKVAEALGRSLDLGQMTGNGLSTRRSLRAIAAQADGDDAAAHSIPAPMQPRDGSVLPPADPDRLELAKIESAEQDARRKRRDNERDEGNWVLAEEVRRQSARAMARELAQVEQVLRDGARALADTLGVDYRAARKVLIDTWRAYRQSRSETLAAEAGASVMTEDEQKADV